jgi:hypothetical protein
VRAVQRTNRRGIGQCHAVNSIDIEPAATASRKSGASAIIKHPIAE